jgi:hypothetical protein
VLTPTPGPYTTPIVEPTPPPAAHGGGVARPTAFAATVQTPIAPTQVHPSAPPQQPAYRPAAAPTNAVPWQAPVIRPKAEPPIDPIVTPKKSNVPLIVLLALVLTVALVAVAIVANEYGYGR